MSDKKGLPVFYDDEPTPEQIEELQRLVADEFATGDWIFEGECLCCGKSFAEHGPGGECPHFH